MLENDVVTKVELFLLVCKVGQPNVDGADEYLDYDYKQDHYKWLICISFQNEYNDVICQADYMSRCRNDPVEVAYGQMNVPEVHQKYTTTS